MVIYIFTHMGEAIVSHDRKAEALRRHGCLNRNPERVRDRRFVEEEFFDPQDLLQVKYEMVRAVRAERLPIAGGARRFGLSRPTCYKAIRAFDEDGLLGLLPERPGPRRAHKLIPEVVAFLTDAAQREPFPGMDALARMVRDRFGVSLHRRSVQRALASRKKGPQRPRS